MKHFMMTTIAAFFILCLLPFTAAAQNTCENIDHLHEQALFSVRDARDEKIEKEVADHDTEMLFSCIATAEDLETIVEIGDQAIDGFDTEIRGLADQPAGYGSAATFQADSVDSLIARLSILTDGGITAETRDHIEALLQKLETYPALWNQFSGRMQRSARAATIIVPQVETATPVEETIETDNVLARIEAVQAIDQIIEETERVQETEISDIRKLQLSVMNDHSILGDLVTVFFDKAEDTIEAIKQEADGNILLARSERARITGASTTELRRFRSLLVEMREAVKEIKAISLSEIEAGQILLAANNTVAGQDALEYLQTSEMELIRIISRTQGQILIFTTEISRIDADLTATLEATSGDFPEPVANTSVRDLPDRRVARSTSSSRQYRWLAEGATRATEKSEAWAFLLKEIAGKPLISPVEVAAPVVLTTDPPAATEVLPRAEDSTPTEVVSTSAQSTEDISPLLMALLAVLVTVFVLLIGILFGYSLKKRENQEDLEMTQERELQKDKQMTELKSEFDSIEGALAEAHAQIDKLKKKSATDTQPLAQHRTTRH